MVPVFLQWLGDEEGKCLLREADNWPAHSQEKETTEQWRADHAGQVDECVRLNENHTASPQTNEVMSGIPWQGSGMTDMQFYKRICLSH